MSLSCYCCSVIPSWLAHRLYRAGEHKGDHVRLDSAYDLEDGRMKGPRASVASVIENCIWAPSRSYAFSHGAHINLQEAKALKSELLSRCTDLEGSRSIAGIDSMALSGAWAKGRSSSHALNKILQSCVGWTVLGQQKIIPVILASADTPADFP